MVNRIGDYEILKELGKGGTSTCYLAIKPPLERKVLLKVLYPQFVTDTEILTRFEREARIMSRLAHPNIVQVLDFGKVQVSLGENSFFIAMEFIEGEPLKQLLLQKEFSIEEKISIMIGLLRALSYVHTKGVVHRDIKPSNIIIATDGTPMLTDFGLAWAKNLTGITQKDTFLGTPEYMSLEQLKGEKIDERTDIYSLGIVFLELFSGLKAYPGANYGEIIQNILTKEPIGLTELDSSTSEEMASIIKKMIQKDKNLRYKTATDTLLDIRKSQQVSLGSEETAFVPAKIKNLLWTTSLLGKWIVVIMLIIGVIWGIRTLYKLRPAPDERLEMRDESAEVQGAERNNAKLAISNEQLTTNYKVQDAEVRSKYPVYIHVLPYAKIYINDSLIGESPPGVEIELKSQKYSLTLKNPIFPELTKQIEPRGAERIDIDIVKEFAYLLISVDPWAEVYIDGENYGTTPLGEPLILLSGKQELKLHNPYYEDYIDTLNLERGDTLQVNIELKKR